MGVGPAGFGGGGGRGEGTAQLTLTGWSDRSLLRLCCYFVLGGLERGEVDTVTEKHSLFHSYVADTMKETCLGCGDRVRHRGSPHAHVHALRRREESPVLHIMHSPEGRPLCSWPRHHTPSFLCPDPAFTTGECVFLK